MTAAHAGVLPPPVDLPPVQGSKRDVVQLRRRTTVTVISMQRQLHAARSVRELLAVAADAAPAYCGFDRALVIGVCGTTLSAQQMTALRDEASDRMRRVLLADPPRLRSGSAEAEFIRVVEGGRGESASNESVLAERCGLRRYAFGAIAPEDRVIALLVVDRDEGPVHAGELRQVQSFAQMISASLERMILRERITHLADEMRYMTASANALVREGLAAPLSLSEDQETAPTFALRGAVAPQSPDALRDLLTKREWSVARQVVGGQSNREIAESLQLSPETVKKYVSRVMRKLGAANRADAAVRCLSLREARD
jgi:LuxR family transcriptional regulator, regulator of acetate metabolism